MSETYITQTEYPIQESGLYDVVMTLEHISDDLADYSASVSFSPRGWLSVRLAISAVSAEQAARTTCLTLRDLLGRMGFDEADREPLVLEVYTESEFKAREGFVGIPNVLGAADVAERLAVSRVRVNQLIDDRRLPGTKVGNSYAIPLEGVFAYEARTYTAAFTGGPDLSWTEMRTVFDPFYDALKIVGMPRAYAEAQKSERGEGGDTTAVQIWQSAVADVRHAVAALGYNSTDLRVSIEKVRSGVGVGLSPRDLYTEQMIEEETRSMGEGQRRELNGN